MGKAERNRARSARERIAAQQAAARKAEQRRRLFMISGAIGLVIVVVVGLIVIKSLDKPGKALPSGTLPASVASDITGVPASTLSAVGTGAIPSLSDLPLKGINGAKPLTLNGKPEMLFIGAEYCPYCAATRWAMAVALSRFGTLGLPLRGIHSSSTDVYPNTPTLSFLNQKYTSKYLTFKPIENVGLVNNGVTLQPTTAAESALWKKYDNGSEAFPFIDFGNKAALTGPPYDPQILHGLTWAEVASDLHNPNSTVAKNVLGAANYLTAAMCRMTNNAPSSVCTAKPIPSIEAKL